MCESIVELFIADTRLYTSMSIGVETGKVNMKITFCKKNQINTRTKKVIADQVLQDSNPL